MNEIKRLRVLALTVGLVWGTQVGAQERDVPTPVETMALTEVPAEVVSAAQKARPGVVLQSARQVWWRDEGVYILEGRDYGKAVRIEVTASGLVLNAYQTD